MDLISAVSSSAMTHFANSVHMPAKACLLVLMAGMRFALHCINTFAYASAPTLTLCNHRALLSGA